MEVNGVRGKALYKYPNTYYRDTRTTYVYIPAGMHTYIHAYIVYTHTKIYTHTNAHKYIHKYNLIYIHSYIHVFT